MNNDITLALADDHMLFRKGIKELINGFTGFSVIAEAADGTELLQQLEILDTLPNIVILDINMKPLNGFETAKKIKKSFPEIKILALSMYVDENSIIKMIKSGAHGYLLKDADPDELKSAFEEVMHRGFYYSNVVGEIVLKNLHNNMQSMRPLDEVLNDREIEFLELAATEMTYKEIADKMNLSPRTIDGYRESLFERLNAKNRVGLVMAAIKNGIIQI
ncbi:MAG: response regulator transcription factor [Bacteroidota bacterium]